MHRWLLGLILVALPALAAERFYRVAPADLKPLDGAKWPESTRGPALFPGLFRVEMDTGAEAYPLGSWEINGDLQGNGEQILIRSTSDAKPTGALILTPQPRWSRDRDASERSATVLRFEVTAAPAPATLPATVPGRAAASGPQDVRSQFYYAKARHYALLQRQGLPGAAWFGYQAQRAEKEIAPGQRGHLAGFMGPVSMWEHPEYDLFTGGRAISENLQLDRPISRADQPSSEQPAAGTDVSSITGISVAEMDFTKLLDNTQPQTDALANLIPADQYAAFFPSITSLFQMADQVKVNAFPVIENLIPPSEDTAVVQRYEKQLGLEPSELARLLGPNLVSSVAITGSDPLFPTGTDVAILFRSPSPQLLSPILLTRIAASAGSQVKAQTNASDGLSYTAFVTPDRSVSSYVAIVGDTVTVSNSLVQLRAIARTPSSGRGSLASSPEYRFFRSRYQLGDPSESLLLVVPDAAIRRWCSARWRIADARRIVARAKLLQIRAEELASGKVPAESPRDPRGPRDPVYGDLTFLTPISELPVDKVSPSEFRAYTQWRDRYQQYWRGAFDPIALRMGFAPSAISADLTVMPLIASTDYRDMIEVTRGVPLQPSSGDPHDAIIHFVMSINRDSDPVRKLSSTASGIGLPVDPLSWLGTSLALYVDDDPVLKELATADDPEQYLQKHVTQLPVALRVESSNPLKLAAFLTALRTRVDQTAPRLTTWQNLESSSLPYVKITSANRIGPDEGQEVSVCYAALPDSLLISPSETLIQRALARASARAAAATQPSAAATQSATPTTRPWLGTNVAIQARSRVADLLHLMRSGGPNPVAEAGWRNLPVLNEYHRLFPDQDPVALYERAWGARLVCPAGGQYVWNEQLRTVESTVTGCPEAPRKFTTPDLVMDHFSFGSLGLSFENKGLRARMVLEMPTAQTNAAKPQR